MPVRSATRSCVRRFPRRSLLFLLAFAAPLRLDAQELPRLLVAPFNSGAGIDEEFGEKVAEEVRKGLEEVGGVELVDEQAIENAIKMFVVQAQVLTLTPVHWRQIGGQLEADLVLIGSADGSDAGVQINAMLIEPWWGDELPLPATAVPDDGDSEAEQAAVGVVQGFAQQLVYLESLERCKAHGLEGAFEFALQSCDEAIEMHDSGMRAFYLRARANMGLERWVEAASDLETALSAGPRLAITVASYALQGLAFSHVKLGNLTLATNLYRQYLQLNPNDADERLSIAMTLESAGESEVAREIVEEGLALEPTNERFAAFLEDPAAYASSSLAAETEGPPCSLWTVEVKNREPVEIEVYIYLEDEVVPIRQVRGRQARGRLIRTIRENGLETLTLTGPKPILMFYEYRPATQAVRQPVIVGGQVRYETVAEAQQESRSLFALVSPFETEPHDMRRLDFQFICDSN